MKKFFTILTLAICFCLCSCVGTITPHIQHFEASKHLTPTQLKKLSGVIATNKITGDRTVESSFIDTYKKNWDKYHQVADLEPVVTTKLKNGNYILDIKHFQDAVLLLELKANGIVK